MIILTVFLLLISSMVSAQQLAFPTAEGFGRHAEGGRGGVVCHVTSTGTTLTGSQYASNPHYSGTYRYCVKTTSITGPRTVIFDVAGTFNFHTDTSFGGAMFIDQPKTTIAGQTAPGNGVQIRGLHQEVRTSDVILRHVKFRLGSVNEVVNSHDALAVWTGAADVIIDHASLQWGTDEINGYGSNMARITVQNSLIAEGLKAPDGLNSNLNGYCTLVDPSNGYQPEFSILKNIMYRCKDRVPNVKGGKIQMVNNLIAGVSANSVFVPFDASVDAEIIGNSYRDWASSSGNSPYLRLIGHPWLPPPSVPDTTVAETLASSIYLDDNRHNVLRPTDGEPESDIYTTSGTTLMPISGTPLGFPALQEVEDSDDVRANRLATAGATKPIRDSMDARIVTALTAETGASGSLNTEADVGGYITLTGTARDVNYDTDHDGIPNAWETACSSSINSNTSNGGLSTSDANDGAELVTTTGYTKLEHYLNEMAGDYPLDSCGGLDSAGDTTAPTGVAITAPSASATVSGSSVTYSATATDETAMGRVEFYQNDVLITQDTSSPYSITWDTTLLTEGNKTLKVIAYDTSENSTESATVNVVVDNELSYIAVHTASSPTINGTLTEFAGANPVVLNGTGGLSPLNTTDLRLMWNSTALYIGALTTDSQLAAVVTSHDQNTTPQIYNDDSIEIVIDTDNDGVWETTDYKFIINAQNATWDARNLSDLSYEPTYSSARVLTTDLNDGADDTSWAVEIAIPWAQMGIGSPAEDQVYGINVQINDMDASRTTYRWNGSINTIGDARDVTLGPDSGTDTTDPTNVAIIDPLDGQFISGTYAIQATAQDDVGMASVAFYEGANLLCTDTTPSGGVFSCDWVTTGESEGSYTLKVTACDTAGTPNCVDSTTVGVDIDNTVPTNPTGLTVATSVSDGELVMLLDWTASTDASGAPTYSIERCIGTGCSDFTELSTSDIDLYSDDSLSDLTVYCYRVRAQDAALNLSAAYSNTACEKTLDVVFVTSPPENLSTSANATLTFPSVVTALSTSASSTPTEPLVVTSLSTSAASTVTFPSVATGVQSP